MKRIIDGVTYNTDTATLIAEAATEDDSTVREIALYQGRTGVYFNVDTVTTHYRDRDGERQQRVSYEWERVGGAADARDFCEKWGLTILRDDIEDMPPEAEPGEKLATLYVRLPPSLKSAIEAKAAEQKVSANVFALRCLEGCVGTVSPDMATVHSFQAYDHQQGAMVQAPGKSTAERIATIGGKIIPDTERVVPRSYLDSEGRLARRL